MRGARRSEALTLPVKHRGHIANALKTDLQQVSISDDAQFIMVTAAQTVRLREITSFYLNSLEVVFFAWKNNIGDRKMIAEEFGALLATKTGAYPLDEIRRATGKYPSIAKFISEKKEEENRKQRETPPSA